MPFLSRRATRVGSNAALYVSGAAAAYVGPGDVLPGALFWGGLRAYSAATAGTSAVRLIRSSDNADANIATVGGTGALNAGDAFFNGSSYKVVTVYDKSGNGLDFTQSDDSKRPIFVLSGIGGKPAMTADASGEKFLQATFTAQSQPFGVAMVVKSNAFTNGGAYLSDEVAGWYVGTDGGSGAYRVTAPNPIDSATGDTNGHSKERDLLGRQTACC